MSHNFNAVIFDMDGLLVNSEIVWYAAEEEMINSRGHIYSDDVREKIVGLRVDEFMDKLRIHYNLPETLEMLVDELNNRMIELIPVRVTPQPGALEMLEYVVRHNIPRAVASNSSLSIIQATMKSQGWDKYFSVYCTADDEVMGKPAPYVYLKAAERLGIDPTTCLGLEDSPNGAKAVVAAGMTCFAVPDKSHSTPAAFEAITPHVFDNLHEVLAKLNGGGA